MRKEYRRCCNTLLSTPIYGSMARGCCIVVNIVVVWHQWTQHTIIPMTQMESVFGAGFEMCVMGYNKAFLDVVFSLSVTVVDAHKFTRRSLDLKRNEYGEVDE